MLSAKSSLAIFLCLLTAAPGFGQSYQITGQRNHGIFNWLANNYTTHPIPRTSFEDSPRMDKLMRAGNIYLSLRDAIALALENNLDIENARYNPKLSEANLFRAQAGALLRNVSSSISSGPSSASIGVLAANALGSGGTGASASSSGTGGVLSGLSVQLAGSAIPNLDPSFFINGQFVHNTTIETATNITGTNFLVTQYKSSNYGIQQGFLTGTSLQLGMGNQFGVSQNSPFNMFSPYSQSSLQFSIQQNLLQGFRPSVNNRAIRVAKNQLHISDLTFKNQVMATVANVVSLYWDLVSDIEALKVKQQTLELDTKLYTDNKRRAELGAIAPIDIVQAEAEMKSAQQDVTNAETQVLQQETILKTVLTRSGLDRAEIVNAHIVPTDHFDIPSQEAVRPVQDLITEAMTNRPDVEQSMVGLEDARITTLGVKDAMLPQLTAFASMSNSGLAGQVNSAPVPVTGANGQTQLVQRGPGDVNGYFLGGYGTVLGQLFGRNFPNYSAGVSLTIPIRNRAAQADYVTDQLNYRQQLIQDKQLHNSIRQGVINSRVALSQARTSYDTSVEARKLQEQTATGTRRKYELGTATILDVVITQRDTTARELAEVQAKNSYIHSRINLENVLGRILQTYDVSIEDAKKGVVGREPDLIPAVPQANNQQAAKQ
jgi:outer membrane protein TolC